MKITHAAAQRRNGKPRTRLGVRQALRLCAAAGVILFLRPVYAQSPQLDYSRFLHSSQKHSSLACNSCHERADNSATPRFPGHKACTDCHRSQFTTPQVPMCTICHGARTATFKTVPTQHASCFNCHWKSQEPVAGNCNGCHKLATAPYVVAEPTRISAKYVHDGGGEKKQHVAECTTCHINITKAASLRGLKPDVPITACTECHNKDGLRQDLNKELIAIDKNRSFTCVYCHADKVGSLDPPASHYLIAERPPLKRKDIK